MAALPFDFRAPLPLPTEAAELGERLAVAASGIGTALTIISGRPISVTAGDALRMPSSTLPAGHVAVGLSADAAACWLVASAGLALRLADLLMGGRGVAPAEPREPSELELRLVGQRLADVARCLLTDAFGQPGAWRLGGVRPVADATLPTSVLHLAATLALPEGDPEPLAVVLPLPDPPTVDEAAGDVSAAQALAAVPLPLQATLGHVVLSASDMAQLGTGDVLTLAHKVDTPVTVAVSGRPVFAATLAARRGRLALVVSDVANGAPTRTGETA